MEMGRAKKSNPSRPGRGFVFGPKSSEIELSASGKRLRVEQGSVGRPGRSVELEHVNEQQSMSEKNRNANSMGDQLEQETGISSEAREASGSLLERPVDEHGA